MRTVGVRHRSGHRFRPSFRPSSLLSCSISCLLSCLLSCSGIRTSRGGVRAARFATAQNPWSNHTDGPAHGLAPAPSPAYPAAPNLRLRGVVELPERLNVQPPIHRLRPSPHPPTYDSPSPCDGTPADPAPQRASPGVPSRHPHPVPRPVQRRGRGSDGRHRQWRGSGGGPGPGRAANPIGGYGTLGAHRRRAIRRDHRFGDQPHAHPRRGDALHGGWRWAGGAGASGVESRPLRATVVRAAGVALHAGDGRGAAGLAPARLPDLAARRHQAGRESERGVRVSRRHGRSGRRVDASGLRLLQRHERVPVPRGTRLRLASCR